MRLTSVLLTLLLPVALSAQTDGEAFQRMIEGKRQTTEALVRMARTITDAAAAEIRSADTWEAVRQQRREQMRDMLGLLPWPERTPLNVRITGTLDKGQYTVEKLAFESLPKIYATANLYVPKQRPAPLPAIIYVCGHAYSPHGNKAKYQRHGISFAKNGYVALVIDSIQIAETFALHHGIKNQVMFEWYSRGYTPAGVEVWNAIRAIDYLETRSEVDSDRIGITGRSGGAAMSWFTASVEPRIKVVVPVMGISTYAANVAADTQRLHCDCMFVINNWRHDMLHQGALIAPRPLLMMHGRQDLLFPELGYEEFEETVGALYRSLGRGEAFGNIVVDTAHADSDYLREQAIRWFDRHLKKAPERELDLEYTDAPEDSLAVFPAGPPADAENFRVHDTFLKTPPFRRFSTLDEWEQRRRQLLDVLKRSVFGGFPQTAGAVEVHRTKVEGSEQLSFESEPGVEIRALLRRPEEPKGRVPALLYIASDGDTPRGFNDMMRWVNSRDDSVRVMVYPRGVGELGWDHSFWKDTLRNAMHVGHTVDSLRLWDVLRAVEALRADEAVDPARITVLGRGISGMLGLYAAILDDGIHQVVLMNPPSTHLEGPIFLNVLRYLDLPEAAALLAPRRLNFYGRLPAAFESVRHVYSLYGNPDHLHLTMDIEAVLQGRYHHDFASGI